MNDNNFNELTNVWWNKICKMTQWFKEVCPIMFTSSVVCSFLFILFQWSKTLLQMKYYNWVRDKNKRLCVWLRGCVWCVWCVLDEQESSLFIVLSTFNEKTTLILRINYFEQFQEVKRGERQQLMNRQKNRSTRTEARSVERLGRAGYMQLLDTFCLFARLTQELGRASWSSNLILSVSFCSSKASSKTLCTSSLNAIKTNNSHDFFNK